MAQPQFKVGERVCWRGIAQTATVSRVDASSGEALYCLDFGDGPYFWALEEDLAPAPALAERQTA